MMTRQITFKCCGGDVDILYDAAIKMTMVRDYLGDNTNQNEIFVPSIDYVDMKLVRDHLYSNFDEIYKLDCADMFGIEKPTRRIGVYSLWMESKLISIMNAALFLGYDLLVSIIATAIAGKGYNDCTLHIQ